MTPTRLALVLAAIVLVPACASPQEEEPRVESGEDNFGAEPAGAATLESNYESLTGVEKQKRLARMIAEGEYCAKSDTQSECLEKLPTGGLGYFISALPGLFSLGTTFNHPNDEAPEGRKKLFHPYGVAGQAEFTPTYAAEPTDKGIHRERAYTGVLAPGGKSIPLILRMAPGGGSSLIPGASVKFLIDGKPSVNFVGIHDFTGLPKTNQNYFSQDLGHIYPDAPFIINAIFSTATDNPSHLPITHLGAISPNGKDVALPAQLTPYEIVLRPNPAVAQSFPNTDEHDFRLDLVRIKPGTPVYDVMARALETDIVFEKLGTIRTTSPLIASSGGDKQLFFKHAGGK